MADTITIDALDDAGSFALYRAEPAGPPTGAIIVVQEIFGVNRGIRRKADEWAARGYLALAPDMFWRFAPGLDLDPDMPADRDRAMALIPHFDADKGILDIEATIRTARAQASGGKVGVVGFCLGGSIAYLAAMRTDIDAAVGYYGGQIGKYLNESHAIARPLMLHFAEEDAHITAAARAPIHAALDGNAHVVIHEYAGVGHGFADTFGQRRSDAAAAQADARTIEFFAGALA